MADVKKIKIQDTSYDIKDDHALRGKNTSDASGNSFIDMRAGTSTYPTTYTNKTDFFIAGAASYFAGSELTSFNNVTILGNSSATNGTGATIVGSNSVGGAYSVVVGYNAGNTSFYTYTVAIGCNAKANASGAIAIGYNVTANAQSTTAIGYNARANFTNNTAVGYNAYTSGNYSTAFGAGTTASSSYSVAVGFNAKTLSSHAVSIGASSSANSSSSTAIGYGAIATTNYSVQLGQGSTQYYGSLQFRQWPVIGSNGKIFAERLPDGTLFAVAKPVDLYNVSDDKIAEQAMLYMGETNPLFTNGLTYKGVKKEGNPFIRCGYVDGDWIDSTRDVIIDQKKFFEKLATITKDRIDNADVENGVMGGDNAEMSIYFYYDADNSQYFVRFDSDSLESGFRHTPDDYYMSGFEEFEEFGVYINNFHMPEDIDGEYEFMYCYYYAPVYCDGYSWNSDIASIDYFTLGSVLIDSDWGAGVVIDDMSEFEYEVNGTNYNIGVIPETYISKIDGDEYDGVTFRWEWNGTDWSQYINGEYVGYEWTTAELATQFGITLDSSEGDTEYIELYLRGAVQKSWRQFNPVNAEDFATHNEFSSLRSQVNTIEEHKTIKRIQNQPAGNLNNLLNSGLYHLEAGCTNGPAGINQGASGDVYVLVTRSTGYCAQVLFADYTTDATAGGTSYGLYVPHIYVRSRNGNYWSNWSMLLNTEDAGVKIQGFDKSKKQYLAHVAGGASFYWEDAE